MPSGQDAGIPALAHAALSAPPGRDWWKASACTPEDSALFFAHDDPALSAEQAEEMTTAAKALCAGCPVRRDCLAEALAIPSLQGVWGGTDDRERRRLRRHLSAGVVLFDECPEPPGGLPDSGARPTSSAAPDGPTQPGPQSQGWNPPAWAEDLAPSTTRWERIGQGPGVPGAGTTGNVEWVCRPAGDGRVRVYARLLPEAAS